MQRALAGRLEEKKTSNGFPRETKLTERRIMRTFAASYLRSMLVAMNRAVAFAVVLAIEAFSCKHRPPGVRDLVVAEASALRADWVTLPVVATPTDHETIARHSTIMSDPDTDERARFGPFELRWGETGYHSMPREWVDPRVCDPSACDDASVTVWQGAGGIYKRVKALRHDLVADVWYVSTEENAGETLGVAFKRR